MLHIGIIREGKIPTDKRAPLSPSQCRVVMQKFPHVKILVQPSPVRCFKDEEYEAKGIEIKEDLSMCDILLGIKEVPINMLIPNKTYLFFSHTIKKQAHNRKLLQSILEKNIKLVDYETLTNEKGERLIAFGWYAGWIGAYNALLMCGKRYGLFDLKRAFECFDKTEMLKELEKVQLPPIKIALTGGGRVATGAMELLEKAKIRQVSVQEYLQNTDFREAVYVQLRSADYHAHKEGKPFAQEEFYQHPERFASTFSQFYAITDLLIACAYWNPDAPLLFTKQEMRQANFRISMVADITCDIDGSIPCTQQSANILDPIYDYDKENEMVCASFSDLSHINVMAVDNLPTELPRDASEYFGEVLIENVFPHLLCEDREKVIRRATIAEKGKLMSNFAYLEEYVNELQEADL